mmetsp:Transcript_19801/g.46208  ORF Transcript_19801/g.46208 Transcript_19801/m.46208 type:complete len:838 (+) Transcript_19801:91-2604(+)
MLTSEPALKKSKRPRQVSGFLKQWVVQNVTEARQCLAARSRGRFHEAASRFVAVLEEVPDLWPELHTELLLAVWLASDLGVQARLSEGAAGCLIGASDSGPAVRLQPRNLSGLFNVIGKALADEGRYCAAFRALHRGFDLAADKLSREESLASILQLRSRALALWHFSMLNDRPRNQAFAAAIFEALHGLPDKSSTGERYACLDIGTGTGLFALICREFGQNICGLEVHACEQNDLLFALAKEIVSNRGAHHDLGLRSAGVSSSKEVNIHLHLGHSSSLQLPPVDMIICEAVDAELLGEGFLRTALDACKRLLKPAGKLIPCGATVYGQLVQSSSLRNRFTTVGGCFDLENITCKPRDAYVCDFLDTLDHRVLSEPQELLQIQFDNPAELERQLQQQDLGSISIRMSESGTAHALVVWWELKLDTCGKHFVSSRPGRQDNHWPQVLWPIWSSKQKDTEFGALLEAGECVRVGVTIAEDHITYTPTVEDEDKGLTFAAKSAEQNTCISVSHDDILALSSDDLQWLHDIDFWAGLKRQCAQIRQTGPCLLDASWLVLPAALAIVAESLSKDTSPTAYVSSCKCRKTLAQAFLAGNGLHQQVEFIEGEDCPIKAADRAAPSAPHQAGLVLIIADAVQRSGDLRPDLFKQVSEAHQHCVARGRTLSVLPYGLQMTLSLIESFPLARGSRVNWPLCDEVRVDVRSLNFLAPGTFEAMSEARLAARRLSQQKVLQLPLSCPSTFTAMLESLAVGQQHRLGPIRSDGILHGVLCEWSWSFPPHVGCDDFELRDFGKAGFTWPEALPSKVSQGDFVVVDVRAVSARGLLVIPVQVQTRQGHLAEE